MQRCGVCPGAKDPMIGLFLGSRGDAGCEENSFEILLIPRGEGTSQDLCVCGGGDGVGMADQCDFKGGFGHATSVDCQLEDGSVGIVGEEISGCVRR